MAEHTHDHTHSHDHDHEGGDSYFIDQLCMVGLSGAFGVVCLCLWFYRPAPPKTPMLTLILGEQFHIYVLLSGIALTALALTRGVILWKQSRDPAFLKKHDHDHGHDHAHDHAIQEKPAAATSVQTLPMQAAVNSPCGHDHAPGAACDHEHHIGHAHAHHHGHGDHDEADHDHGWAPWRYVVLLVPVILFLLGLPDKTPAIVTKENTAEIAMMTLPELACIGAAYDIGEPLIAKSAEAAPLDFKYLEVMASKPDLRDHWKGRLVEIRGQYAPLRGTDKAFNLVRFKISCCANDAVQIDALMLSRESLFGLKDPDTGVEIKHGDWVKVTGRVEFRENKGAKMTVLVIPKTADIKKCVPDTNPYIQ